MTLDEISHKLERNLPQWRAAWLDELNRVSADPAILAQIMELVKKSALTRRLRPATAQTLLMSNVANFRFGLLVGYLLTTDPCLACNSEGEVCRCCGQPEEFCCCPEEETGGYHATVCRACRGRGDLR